MWRSIDNKELGARPCVRAVRLRVIRDLITHPRRERKSAPVGELGVQLAFQAKQDMAFAAPMIGTVSWRVFHHTHAQRGERSGPPIRRSCLALMFGDFDRGPVRRAE